MNNDTTNKRVKIFSKQIFQYMQTLDITDEESVCVAGNVLSLIMAILLEGADIFTTKKLLEETLRTVEAATVSYMASLGDFEEPTEPA